MTSKTYYSLQDCASNVVTAENLSNEFFTGFYNFMTYMSSAGVVTLTNLCTGQIASGGTNYWDAAQPWGHGAHVVYRWNSSSVRPFDWYMEAQILSGAGTPATPILSNAFTSGWGAGTAFKGQSSNRGIMTAAAVCYSGTTSVNPWQGTGVFGDDRKATIHWNSGSAANSLWVLPRSNGPQGSHNTQKNNMGGLGMGPLQSSTTAMRYHFFSDGDALLTMCDVTDDATYSLCYLGPFELRSALSGTGIMGSTMGMAMIESAPAGLLAGTITIGATWGDQTGDTTSTPNGGIVHASVSGSRQGTNDGIGATFMNSAQQKNTFTNQFDEFPIYVGMTEGVNVGLLGTLNTGLIRYIIGVQSEDITSDFTRVVFGGSTTVGNLKITAPWSGTLPPRSSTDRTGSLKTWTKNYG